MEEQHDSKLGYDATLNVNEKKFYGLYIGTRLPSGVTVVNDSLSMPKSARVLFTNIIQFYKMSDSLRGFYDLVKYGGGPLAEDFADSTIIHQDMRMHGNMSSIYDNYLKNVILKRIFAPFHPYYIGSNGIRYLSNYTNHDTRKLITCTGKWGSSTAMRVENPNKVKILLAASCSGKSHFVTNMPNIYYDGDHFIKWPTDPNWLYSSEMRREVNIGLWQQVTQFSKDITYVYNGDVSLIDNDLMKKIEFVGLVHVPLDIYKANIRSRDLHREVYDIDYETIKRNMKMHARENLVEGKEYIKINGFGTEYVGYYRDSGYLYDTPGRESYYTFVKDGKVNTYIDYNKNYKFTDKSYSFYIAKDTLEIKRMRRNPENHISLAGREQLYRFARQNNIPIFKSFIASLSHTVTNIYKCVMKQPDNMLLVTQGAEHYFDDMKHVYIPTAEKPKIFFGLHMSFRVHTNEYARYSGLTQHMWKHVTRYYPQYFILRYIHAKPEVHTTPCGCIDSLKLFGEEISPSGHMLGAFTWLAFPHARFSGMPNLYPDFHTYLNMYMINQHTTTKSLEPYSRKVAYHRFIETYAGIIGSYFAIKIILKTGVTIRKRDAILWKLYARRAIRMIRVNDRTWYFGVSFDRDADGRFGPIKQ